MAALVLLGTAMMAGASAQQLEGPVWRAERIKGSDAAGGAQSSIAFAAGGKVTGSGGCNRLIGTALISGDTIAFGDMGTTRMACAPPIMAQEQNFLAALAATRTFRLEGGRLTFYDAGGTETVRFSQQR